MAMGEAGSNGAAETTPSKPVAESPQKAKPSSVAKRPSTALPNTTKLVRLAGLSDADIDDCDPWISFDGLTLYWSRYNYTAPGKTEGSGQDRKQFGLYTASRNSTAEPFGKPRRLSQLRIRHPTVSQSRHTVAAHREVMNGHSFRHSAQATVSGHVPSHRDRPLRSAC